MFIQNCITSLQSQPCIKVPDYARDRDRRWWNCKISLKIKYVPFTEGITVGFTFDAIVGSTVEVSPVVTCVGLTRSGTEYNAAGVNDAAMDDPTFTIGCVVT